MQRWDDGAPSAAESKSQGEDKHQKHEFLSFSKAHFRLPQGAGFPNTVSPNYYPENQIYESCKFERSGIEDVSGHKLIKLVESMLPLPVPPQNYDNVSQFPRTLPK